MEEQKLIKRKRKAENENNQTLLLSACGDLAELYAKEGRYNLSVEEYKKIADIYKTGNKLMDFGRANRGIGEAYMGLHDFTKSLEYQKLYLNVANQENNKLEQQRALATIGHTYLTWYLETQTDADKTLKNAFKFFMKSLVIAESLSGIDKLEKVDMLARLFSNLGLVKECLGDYNEALQLLNRSIGICKQHDIYEQLHRGYISIASLYEKRSEYHEAIHHYNLAIDSAKNIKDSVDLMCAALLLKSESLIKLADFRGAKQVLLKAYKLKTPNIEERKLIERNLRIVIIMCRTEDNLLKASRTEQEKKVLYETMGDRACDLKNFVKAIEYYKLMLECAEKSGVSGRELASCYYSLAETYKDNSQFTEAVDYFEKEYGLCTELADRLNTLSKIADTKEAGGAPIIEVKAVYERAFTECRFCKNLKEEKRMMSRCITYLRRNNSNAEAFELQLYLDMISEASSEPESSSSDNESEDSELKADVGIDVNLDEISDDSDIENQPQQNTSKEGMGVGRRRNKNIVKKNEKGESQLHIACINGSFPVVRHLVEQGHPVNIRDNSGWLPLHEACNHGHLAIVEFLLDKGAAINDRGGTHCNGVTPLYDASSNGHLEIVELLLNKGASAIVKTDDGDTALNILMQWQKKNPVMGDNLRLYESLVKRMSEAMEKVGQSSRSIPVCSFSDGQSSDYGKNTQRIVARERRVRNTERQSLVLDAEENSEYCSDFGGESFISQGFDAKDEYVKVMGTLRNRTNNVDVSPTAQTSFSSKRSALMVVDDDEDDWLQDDMQSSSRGAKKRRTSTVFPQTAVGSSNVATSKNVQTNYNKSPLKRTEIKDMEGQQNFFPIDLCEDFIDTEDLFEISDRRSSNGSRSSTEGSGGVKRRHQASLLDAGFSRVRSETPSTSTGRRSSSESRNKPRQSKITHFGHRSNEEIDLVNPVSSQDTITSSQVQVQPVTASDLMVFVDVKIEERMFRIPVLLSQVQTNTIGWLAQQAASKYARREGSKPCLELETMTGALLSDEDPLSVLFPLGATQADPVVGRVVKLTLPALVDRYREASTHLDIDVDALLCRLLEEVSITLNVSSKGILGKNLAPVCKALNHQSTLLELNLSGNFLDADCIVKLCSTLPTLVNLNTLNLRCTTITSSHLAEFVNMFTSSNAPILHKLSSLDLSDNTLKDRSLPHLAVITSHLKLTTLYLSNVRFTEDFFKDFHDESRLNLSEIQYLDISDNALGVADIKRFLGWTSAGKLISLNLSRNGGIKEGLLRALLEILQRDLYDSSLKFLNLSRSKVEDEELFDFLRHFSRKPLVDVNLSYNLNLTGSSLRSLLECSSLQSINLIGCNNILQNFSCNGCDLLQDSDVNGEKILKISYKKSLDHVAFLVKMFKSKYCDCYMEKTDTFLLLSSKKF